MRLSDGSSGSVPVGVAGHVPGARTIQILLARPCTRSRVLRRNLRGIAGTISIYVVICGIQNVSQSHFSLALSVIDLNHGRGVQPFRPARRHFSCKRKQPERNRSATEWTPLRLQHTVEQPKPIDSKLLSPSGTGYCRGQSRWLDGSGQGSPQRRTATGSDCSLG